MELRKRTIRSEQNKLKSKKSRKEIEKRSSQIEDLPGEIWFELFSYFDGQSLMKIFSQLNHFLDSILRDSRLPIHFNIFSSNICVPSLFHSNQLVSLTIDYSHVKTNEILPLDSFLRLRSLDLLHLDDQQLQQLSQFSLANLCQLRIQGKSAKYLTKIISIYFPRVHRMKLHSMGKEFLVKSFSSENNRSQLEKLTLDGKMKFATLFRLWPFVPQLQTLSVINGGIHQCDYWIDEHFVNTNTFPCYLSYLHVTIYDDDLTFSNLERLIPTNLRYLFVSGSMADDDLHEYLSSNNWIRLMSRSSNKCQRIQLDLSSYFDLSDSSGLQKTLIQFRQNPFFRHVIIKSENFFITIKGSIQPEQEK